MTRHKPFPKPTLADFTDAEGYADYYEFDMAMDQWQRQFPDLYERWCGEPRQETPCPVDQPTQDLIDMLTAIAA